MHVAIVSDAWFPQINGVVRTLSRTRDELIKMGHQVTMVTPDQFHNIPCPTYPEIKLAVGPGRKVRSILDSAKPDAIHIATEGPLGWAARKYCRRRNIAFSTSFHTRFPEYVTARLGIPVSWGYALMRQFHNSASSVMVATKTIRDELHNRGFRNLSGWTRGVDTDLFKPGQASPLNLEGPIYLYVGRVAIEKNIRAFLDVKLDGTKVVVGDGPQLPELRKKYPDVQFVGYKEGVDLADHYRAADVFVFPSRTDTFGLVLLEALACGVPVAAYPVPGPLDVINGAPVGVLDEDLSLAAKAAIKLSGEQCRAHALKFSWHATAEIFLDNLCPIN